MIIYKNFTYAMRRPKSNRHWEIVPGKQSIYFVMPCWIYERDDIELFGPAATVIHRHDGSIVGTTINNTFKLVEEYYPIIIKDGGDRENKAVIEMLDFIPYEVDKEHILLHFKDCIYDLATNKWIN